MGKLTKLDMQKKQLLEALEKSLGIVTTACKEVDISRQTFYNWYNSDEDFKKSVDDLHNVALDFAENALLTRIKEKSDTAIIFYLKTQGKKRGYIEKTEIDHTSGGEKLQITIGGKSFDI